MSLGGKSGIPPNADGAILLGTMTAPLDWLDKETAIDLERLFRKHGVPVGVHVLPVSGGDGAFFFVNSRDAAQMREASLIRALQTRLSRKVAVVTDATSWPVTPEPLERFS
jgi:hypothetical protein